MNKKINKLQFQPGFGGIKTGSSLWMNDPISIGCKRLNSIIGAIKSITTANAPTGGGLVVGGGKCIKITLSSPWPEAIADIQDIIIANVQLGTIQHSFSKDAKNLYLIINNDSQRSTVKWYIDKLFSGKYTLDGDYSATNSYGHTVKFVGSQAQGTATTSSSSTATKKPFEIKKNPSATTIPDKIAAAQEAELKEKSADGGINWWLVGGLIAAVVVIYLIVK